MIKRVVTRQQQDIFARRFAAGGVEDCLELPGCKQTLFPAEASTHHKTGNLYGEASTALGAATRQDCTAILGRHASTEAVGTSAFDSAGLESTFHGAIPGWSTTGRNGPRFKRPAIVEKAEGQVNFQPVVCVRNYIKNEIFLKSLFC